MVSRNPQHCKHVDVNDSGVKSTNSTIDESKSKRSEKFTQCARCRRDLLTSMRENNIEVFLSIVWNQADVHSRDSDTNYSVFEIACKTPRRAVFITICIASGARINEINPCHGKYPVHLAAESNDVDNLSALLRAPDLLIENQNSESQTALCMLFETITQDNFNKVWNCIKLLLEYHANINTKNSYDRTPIQLILQNESLSNDYKKVILQYCLLNYYCNLDENTKSLLQAYYPGTLQITEYTSQHELFDQLRDKLNNQKGDKFVEICQEKKKTGIIANLQPEMIRRLLQITIFRGNLKAAQTLLKLKMVDGRVRNCSELLEGLLKKCCVSGDFKILQELLDAVLEHDVSFVNKDPLLSIVVTKMKPANKKFHHRFYMCLDVLLDDRRVEIDKRDGTNCTALQYAGRYKNDRAQRSLLAKGSYIGGEDLFKNRTIAELNPDVLKERLDFCVIALESNTLKINVTNLVAPEFKSGYTEHSYKHSNDASFHHPLSAILNLIQAKTAKHAQIIHHPVISCYLQVHWLNLREVLWFNATINFVHFITLSAYALRTSWSYYFCWVSSASLLLIILMEGILVIRNFKSRSFLGYFPDFFKIMMFITSTFFLSNSVPLIGACAPVMAAINFIKSLDGITKFRITRHIILLQEVVKNMFMCMLPCVLVLLSFAISFYTLLKNKSNTREVTSEMGISEVSENKTYVHSGDPIIVTQIITMSMNVVAGDIHIDENLNYGFLLCFYYLFLICIIIVLFNKLTASMRRGNSFFDDQMKLRIAKQQIKLLIHYEKAFKRNKILHRVDSITIKPNERNKISLKLYNNFKLLDAESPAFIKGEQNEEDLRHGLKMDAKIVWALQNTVNSTIDSSASA